MLLNKTLPFKNWPGHNPIKVFRSKGCVLVLYNCAEDNSLGYHSDKPCRRGTPNGRMRHAPLYQTSRGRTDTQGALLLISAEQLQSPKTTGRISLLQGHEAPRWQVCSLGEKEGTLREQRFGICRFILAWKSGTCTDSPQTTFSENTWTLLGMTAPH